MFFTPSSQYELTDARTLLWWPQSFSTQQEYENKIVGQNQ